MSSSEHLQSLFCLHYKFPALVLSSWLSIVFFLLVISSTLLVSATPQAGYYQTHVFSLYLVPCGPTWLPVYPAAISQSAQTNLNSHHPQARNSSTFLTAVNGMPICTVVQVTILFGVTPKLLKSLDSFYHCLFSVPGVLGTRFYFKTLTCCRCLW